MPSPCSPLREPPKLKDEVGYSLGDGLHLPDAGAILEVDQGSDVEAADAGVAIVGGSGMVGLDDLVEAAAKLSEPVGIHGCILNEGDGLGVAADAHEQPEPRLADGPSLCLVLLCEEVYTGVA